MTSIENLDLPRSIIGRVIKGALPEGAQVQKDAKAAITKACTVFINYLTATALDVTKHGDRKSINANDIFRALAILEFDQFLPMIKVAVQEFQQKAREKRQVYKRNFKEKQANSANPDDGLESGDEPENDEMDPDESMNLDGTTFAVSGGAEDNDDERSSHRRPSIEPSSASKRIKLADNAGTDDGNSEGEAESDDEDADDEDGGTQPGQERMEIS
ncbi:histone-fold-containing protein [Powellomyces hirtus]|nr:histone-fold-containing protein [Powellomyces hirtus]